MEEISSEKKRELLGDLLAGRKSSKEVEQEVKQKENIFHLFDGSRFQFYQELNESPVFEKLCLKYPKLLEGIEYQKAVLANTPLYFKEYMQFIKGLPNLSHMGYNTGHYEDVYIKLEYNQYLEKYTKRIDYFCAPKLWSRNKEVKGKRLKEIPTHLKTVIKFTKKEMREILKYDNLKTHPFSKSEIRDMKSTPYYIDLLNTEKIQNLNK